MRAKLLSPIDGEVTRVMGKVGDLVDGTSATPVVVIDDQEILELHIDTPASDLVRLRLKALAEIRLDALPNVVFQGEVSALSPSVDPATELGTARIAFNDSSPELSRVRIGLSGTVAITAGMRSDAMLAPASSLRRSSEGTSQVVICSPSSTASVRDVTPGIRGVDAVEITDGLRLDEKVVVDHVIGLEDGTPIRDTSTPARGSAP